MIARNSPTNRSTACWTLSEAIGALGALAGCGGQVAFGRLQETAGVAPPWVRGHPSPMGRIAFADESGTDGKTKCYAIGVVSVAKNKLRGFNESFELLRRQHGVSQEAHWEGVNKGHGL